jgi:hypothetical protein
VNLGDESETSGISDGQYQRPTAEALQAERAEEGEFGVYDNEGDAEEYDDVEPSPEEEGAASEEEERAGSDPRTYRGPLPIQEEETPRLFFISVDDIKKALEVFVPPPRWSSATRASNHRVVVIAGAEHSGRYTAALSAWQHFEIDVSGFTWLLYTKKDSLQLSEAVGHAHWEPSSIVVLEDAFVKGIRFSELAGGELAILDKALKAKNSFVVLTTELQDGLADVDVPRCTTAELNLKQVLRTHLEHYRKDGLRPDVAQRVVGLWPKLRSLLEQPKQIDRFCRLLAQQPSNLDETNLMALAESPGILRKSLRAWFAQLSEDMQYYGILAAVFQGLERGLFERIYLDSLYLLRDGKCDFLSDPRRPNLLELREGVQLREGGAIDFEEPGLLRELLRQAAGRQEVLWLVVETLAKRLETQEERLWKDRWQFGAAFGRVGMLDSDRYNGFLDDLASSANRSFAVLAGLALAESIKLHGAEGRSLAVGKLKEWSSSGQTNRQWSSAAAVSRIFEANEVSSSLDHESGEGGGGREGFRSLLLRLLVRLASGVERLGEERCGKELRNAVAETLARIAKIRVESTVEVIRMCSQTPGSFPSTVIKWTVDKLAKVVKVDSRNIMSLLNLTQVFLEDGCPIGAPRLQKFLTTVLRACTQDPVVLSEVRQRLLALAHRGPSRLRRRLWVAVSACKMEESLTGELKQALMVRCELLNGALFDRPGGASCLVVVDPLVRDPPVSETAKVAESRARTVRQLVDSLRNRWEVRVAELGATNAVFPPGSESSPYQRHRLALPILESLGPQWDLVVVVSAGSILDLEDLGEGRLAERSMLISLGDRVASVEGVDRVTLPSSPGPDDISKVEERLEAHWTRRVMEASRIDWVEVLERLGMEAAVVDRPEIWARGIVQEIEDGSGSKTDGLRKLFAGLFYLFSGERQVALRLIASLLAVEDGFRVALGTACAAAFFRLYATVPRGSLAVVPRELFEALAWPLGEAGNDGVEVVLGAVERWIRHPDLVEFLAGGAQNGRGRLLRWADRFAPGRRREFEDFLRTLRRTRIEVEDPSIAELEDQLQGRIFSGAFREWPDCMEGSPLAVVVFGSAGSESAEQVASASLGFFQQFDETGLSTALVRLGESLPILVSGDRIPLSAAGLEKRSSVGLIGSVLEQLDPENTAVVLIVGREPPLDEGDFAGGPWASRLHTVAPTHPEGIIGWPAALPKARTEGMISIAHHQFLRDEFSKLPGEAP